MGEITWIDALVAAAGDDPYELLRLLFMCCHPDLTTEEQIAVALRLVCGLRVEEIARAFLVSESAIAERLARAKPLLRRMPAQPLDRTARLESVSVVLYLLFNEGYSGSEVMLAERAIRLARILVRTFPRDPDLLGLLALFLLQHARVRARFDAAGDPVLLDDQDRSLWDRRMVDEGLALLDEARRHGRPDLFQVQAEIAAVHARAPRAADTDWDAIVAHYGALEAIQPSPVVTLNRAVAVWKTKGAGAALAMIEPLAEPLAAYSHFYGVKGGLLVELGRDAEARVAFTRALALAKTAAEAAHLRQRLERISAAADP